MGGEQEQTLGGEPSQPAEPTGSKIPREQSLKQTSMTGFLKPAASLTIGGCPTTKNLVSRSHQDPPPNKPIGGGSPRLAKGGSIPQFSEEDNTYAIMKMTRGMNEDDYQKNDDHVMDHNIGIREPD